MKACIEAGYLGHVRQPFEDCFDGREIVRLMQRGQRLQACKSARTCGVTTVGRVSHAAVHHTMSNAEDARARVPGSEPPGEDVERAALIADRGLEFSSTRTRTCVYYGQICAGSFRSLRSGLVTRVAKSRLAGRRKHQNFRLDDPALRTRA